MRAQWDGIIKNRFLNNLSIIPNMGNVIALLRLENPDFRLASRNVKLNSMLRGASGKSGFSSLHSAMPFPILGIIVNISKK